MSKRTSSMGPHRLPTGAFTVDSDGNVISSTVPQWVAGGVVREIGVSVVALFHGAIKANVACNELTAQYASFRITARAMRGGAIIFLSPKAPQWVAP